MNALPRQPSLKFFGWRSTWWQRHQFVELLLKPRVLASPRRLAFADCFHISNSFDFGYFFLNSRHYRLNRRLG